MKITNFIKREFITAGPFSGVSSLRNELLHNQGVVVLEDDRFFGVLCKDDMLIRPHVLVIDTLSTKTALEADSTVNYALQVMKLENTDVLPVLVDKKIYGLVYKNDLIDYLSGTSQKPDTDDDETELLKKENKEIKDLILKQKLDLESVVEKRTRELIDLVETKERFIRIIAHELRSPFTSMLGFLNLLKDNLQKYDTETIERFISHIHFSATATFDLLVNLLTWLNAKNKKVPFDAVETNLDAAYIEDILISSRIEAELKGITVDVNIPEDLNVFVDTNMLKVILRNLVNNAIKFTEKGGKVSIFANELENFIEITVKDSGIGLSEEKLMKIFKIEGIASTVGTANELGTGLGLLLSKEFVEIEGGEIWVESVIGTGSEFKFTLPKAFINELGD